MRIIRKLLSTKFFICCIIAVLISVTLFPNRQMASAEQNIQLLRAPAGCALADYSLWDSVQEYAMPNLITAGGQEHNPNKSSASFKGMWQQNKLYILVEVEDSTPRIEDQIEIAIAHPTFGEFFYYQCGIQGTWENKINDYLRGSFVQYWRLTEDEHKKAALFQIEFPREISEWENVQLNVNYVDYYLKDNVLTCNARLQNGTQAAGNPELSVSFMQDTITTFNAIEELVPNALVNKEAYPVASDNTVRGGWLDNQLLLSLACAETVEIAIADSGFIVLSNGNIDDTRFSGKCEYLGESQNGESIYCITAEESFDLGSYYEITVNDTLLLVHFTDNIENYRLKIFEASENSGLPEVIQLTAAKLTLYYPSRQEATYYIINLFTKEGEEYTFSRSYEANRTLTEKNGDTIFLLDQNKEFYIQIVGTDTRGTKIHFSQVLHVCIPQNTYPDIVDDPWSISYEKDKRDGAEEQPSQTDNGNGCAGNVNVGGSVMLGIGVVVANILVWKKRREK